MQVQDIAKGISARAIGDLKAKGIDLSTALESRARDAAAALALTQLEALAGLDVTESQKVAQARFDNITAAGSQGIANALVGSVRSAILEGLELLVITAAG